LAAKLSTPLTTSSGTSMSSQPPWLHPWPALRGKSVGSCNLGMLHSCSIQYSTWTRSMIRQAVTAGGKETAAPDAHESSASVLHLHVVSLRMLRQNRKGYTIPGSSQEVLHGELLISY